jgi:hypothetical protein
MVSILRSSNHHHHPVRAANCALNKDHHGAWQINPDFLTPSLPIGGVHQWRFRSVEINPGQCTAAPGRDGSSSLHRNIALVGEGNAGLGERNVRNYTQSCQKAWRAEPPRNQRSCSHHIPPTKVWAGG